MSESKKEECINVGLPKAGRIRGLKKTQIHKGLEIPPFVKPTMYTTSLTKKEVR